jgi:hypothetical protein
MPVIDELCRRCGGELRPGQRITTKYCSVRCRVAAFRRRRRITRDTLARLEAHQPEAQLPPASDSPAFLQLVATFERPPATHGVTVYFDFFDADPEPWPGFNGSAR